jgi:hypothetical protein
MSKFKRFIINALTKGYVSFPLELIRWWFEKRRKLTEFEAFVWMLSRVNFKDNKVNVYGRSGICRKGESIRSIERWSQEFQWEMGETRAFFGKLLEEGMLERIDHPLNGNHIRIAEYEWLTGKVAQRASEPAPVEERSLFDDFWEHYHKVTRMKPSERTRARAAWDKLTEEQQDRAIEGVEAYYEGLNLKMYCRKAATYLENQSFD